MSGAEPPRLVQSSCKSTPNRRIGKYAGGLLQLYRLVMSHRIGHKKCRVTVSDTLWVGLSILERFIVFAVRSVWGAFYMPYRDTKHRMSERGIPFWLDV